MVNTNAKAGAHTRFPSGKTNPETIPGYDPVHPRSGSAPYALVEAREVRAREQMVAVERAKLLRERVVACYRTEGVNHLENCKREVAAYLASIKNVGVQRLNFGEHDETPARG